MGELLRVVFVLYLIGTLPALLVFMFRAPDDMELRRGMRQSVKYIAWEALFTVFLWPYALHRYVNRER
jgi:hypothetical protein